MQKVNVQTSLSDVYEDVCLSMDESKPKFLRLLKEHIKLEKLIPSEFYEAFNKDIGRPRDYSLESFIWFHQLKNIIGIPRDKAFLTVLEFSAELRELCGFEKVPAASEITRFRQDFAEYLGVMFEKLVELTEPLCRALDPKKADYLIYDPTGIKAYVTENNPKFLNGKLTVAKAIAKKNPAYDPYKGVYSLLPETTKANPFVRHQYINGHFCYAHKAGILTNGMGIIRGIYLFDESFKAKHPEIIFQKTDNPDLDKEIADSISLKPVLSDFFDAHPNFSYKTFIGDASFDSYDNYEILRKDFHFGRICIPLNPRNSSSAHTNFDANGTPLCPTDKTPFTFISASRGQNRSERFKWVCHKSFKLNCYSSARVCICKSPCTNSTYGRCVYTYPSKNIRLFPGIPRGTDHWNNLYRHRTLVERTINILKDDFGVAHRRAYSQITAKADLYFAGITQLLGILLAHAINLPKLFKSVRKLLAA
jgi:hypothetical protein